MTSRAATALTVAEADWFQRPQTRAVYACLNQEGYKTRAVGGAIRNTILGRPVAEVDFATTAPPEEVVRLAAKAGLKTAPTGIDHGTVMVIVDKIPYEVTTLRHDVETFGRHAKVAFGADWAEDAARRDFTMNALYADESGAVHDPLDGLGDILARRVRFIGDPAVRLSEDYLRILRFFRFSAEYADGPFDADGVLACVRARAGLDLLSRERVRSELLRILQAVRAAEACEVLTETGLMQRLAGGVSYLQRFARLCALEAALNLPPEPMARLAALFVAVREDAERLAERLRLSSAESADLQGMIANSAVLPQTLTPDGIEALLYKMEKNGARAFRLALTFAWVDRRVDFDAPDWRGALVRARHWQRPKFPLSGADLLARGFEPGERLGQALKRLETLWVESQFRLSREDLLRKA